MNIDFTSMQSFFTILWKMKTVERWHGKYWDDYGLARNESVPDHVWRMCMMLLYVEGKLSIKYDTFHCLKIILVHDMPEIETGDINAANDNSVYNDPSSKKVKEENERAAMKHILKDLEEPLRSELMDLWEEYEAWVTPEAKVAKSIDKMEAFLHAYETSNAEHYPEHLAFITKMIEGQKGRVKEFDELYEEIKQVFIREYKPFKKKS